VEAVVAARQHAHRLPAGELGEADGALRPRRPGHLQPRRERQARQRLHQRRREPPRLLPPVRVPVPRGGLQLRRPRASARVLLVLLLLLGVVVVGSAAARAARDAERALEHDAERERRDEAAREEREGEDRIGVELACRCRDRPSVRNGAG